MAKIFIVDDDKETTLLLEAVIQTGGHEAFSTNESTKAINAIEAALPDVILLDIMMPDINGITLCKQIKADPNLSHIPVAMISALSDEGSKRDSANAGAATFITKPILPKDLLNRIGDMLAARQS
jgi:CheY-like chemotaxis protein